MMLAFVDDKGGLWLAHDKRQKRHYLSVNSGASEEVFGTTVVSSIYELEPGASREN